MSLFAQIPKPPPDAPDEPVRGPNGDKPVPERAPPGHPPEGPPSGPPDGPPTPPYEIPPEPPPAT